jgi:hypothetical protein
LIIENEMKKVIIILFRNKVVVVVVAAAHRQKIRFFEISGFRNILPDFTLTTTSVPTKNT